MERIPRILTVSSANMDMTQKVMRMPRSGETLIGESYRFSPGGKGANAALAVARLGGDSVFCTRLGNDTYGRSLASFYERSGVDIRFIAADPDEPTGLASVMVDGDGSNRIIVFPGANARITQDDLENAMTCFPDAVFLQFEISTEIVIAAAEQAHMQKIPVFVDAGPYVADFPLERLGEIEIFSPNEEETFHYTGVQPTTVESCLRACMVLTRKVKAKYYVLKLGGRGAFVYDGTYCKFLPGYEVRVVDTTAAGDAFTAALTLEYMRSGDIMRAVEYANVVGALTVAKAGASMSIPSAKNVHDFVEKNGLELPF